MSSPRIRSGSPDASTSRGTGWSSIHTDPPSRDHAHSPRRPHDSAHAARCRACIVTWVELDDLAPRQRVGEAAAHGEGLAQRLFGRRGNARPGRAGQALAHQVQRTDEAHRPGHAAFSQRSRRSTASVGWSPPYRAMKARPSSTPPLRQHSGFEQITWTSIEPNNSASVSWRQTFSDAATAPKARVKPANG